MRWTSALFTGVLLLAGCEEHGTPRPGQGAVGAVAVDNAGAAQGPVTPALPGGPAGQTSGYAAAARPPALTRNAEDAGKAAGASANEVEPAQTASGPAQR